MPNEDKPEQKQRYLNPEIQRLADYYHAGRVLRMGEEELYNRVLVFEYPSKYTWSQFSVLVMPCDRFGADLKDAKPVRHCNNPFIKV